MQSDRHQLSARAIQRCSGLALTATLAGALTARLTGITQAGWLAAAGLLLFCFLQWHQLRRAGKVFMILALLMLVLATFSADPLAVIEDGLAKASFLAALLVALGMLRTAADGSPMVRRSGRQLLAQPPGKRYLAFAAGGNLFGTIISFGSLNLLGSMVVQSNTLESAAGDDNLRRRRERTAMLAMLRGFAMSLAWSPLSISLAIVLSTMPTLRWQQLLPLGFATAMLMLVLGWLYHQLSEHRAGPSAAVPVPAEPWTVHLQLIGLIGLILLLVVVLESTLHTSLIVAVMISVPLVALGWIVVQNRHANRLRQLQLVGERLDRFISQTLPNYRMEAVIMSTAAFAGAVVSAFLPPDQVAGLITGIPAPLLPVVAVWIVLGGGLVGINPIVTVMIISAALPRPELFGVAPPVMALAYMISWGLTVSSSPVAMSTLIIGNFCHVSGATVGLRWNGGFTLLAGSVLSLLLVLLVWWLPVTVFF